jgi:thiol-disulfide isomerase/thioredoxin
MSPRRRELLILGSAATAAGVAGAVIGAFALQSRSGAADLLSAQYPDLSGTVRRLSEWRGRPLVCNFWATWCAPCREEIPLLDAARLERADKGLQIVGIAVDSAANVREYVKTTPIGYPVLLGDASAIDLMRRLGNAVGGLPFTVMLDGAGRLRERHFGAFTAPRLSAELERLLR